MNHLIDVNPSLTHSPYQVEMDKQPNQVKPNRSTQPAKRLANTKGMNRQDWLQIRKQGIGSSDAAAACGLNPYMSMLELWMIKTGRMQKDLEKLQNDSYAPLYWGIQLEPLIAEHYQHQTGNKVHRVNAVLQHGDEDLHFMLANLDYAVVGSDKVQILECKSVGQWGAKNWRNGIPLYVIIQVQHQLAVTGKQAAHVCALICGHETKLFKVARNDLVISSIIAAEKLFWWHVENDMPPSVDSSESAAKALQQLYPEHNPANSIDFTHLPEIDCLFDKLMQQDHQIKQHQDSYDKTKHQIQSLMRDADKAVFSQGSVTWRRSKDSTLLDQKALLKDQPELLEKYPQVRAGSRRFNVYANNG